jgi:hypothetical protein
LNGRANIEYNIWKGGREKKVDFIVPLVSTIRLVNVENPPKVLVRMRDFAYFYDYIYKGNITEVIDN